MIFYDEFFKIGDEFNLKPGCPHLIERIEGGLLSYGNDISPNDTPLECGFDKYLNLESEINFLGKEKLIEMKKNGINKKLMGVKIFSETNRLGLTENYRPRRGGTILFLQQKTGCCHKKNRDPSAAVSKS